MLAGLFGCLPPSTFDDANTWQSILIDGKRDTRSDAGRLNDALGSFFKNGDKAGISFG